MKRAADMTSPKIYSGIYCGKISSVVNYTFWCPGAFFHVNLPGLEMGVVADSISHNIIKYYLDIRKYNYSNVFLSGIIVIFPIISDIMSKNTTAIWWCSSRSIFLHLLKGVNMLIFLTQSCILFKTFIKWELTRSFMINMFHQFYIANTSEFCQFYIFKLK